MLDEALVLDSSVIASLFYPDLYSGWSEEVIKKFNVLITSDLAYAEVSNVAWKRIALLNQDKETVLYSLNNAINFIKDVCVIVPTENIYRDAVELATKLRITFYDALFVAIAVKKEATLITIDKKVVKALRNSRININILSPFQSRK